MTFYGVFRLNMLALSASCLLIWGETARAQVDPNIQSRVDSFVPTPRPSDTIVRQETVAVEVPVYQTVTEKVAISRDRQLQLLQAAMKRAGDRTPASIFTLGKLDDKAIAFQFAKYDIKSFELKTTSKRVGTKVELVEKPRVTEITVRLNSAYSFETNASKSNAARASDHIANGSASVLVKSPITGTEEDTMALYGGASSVRYSRLTSKDFDSPNIGAVYTHLIWRTPNPKSDGTITRQTVSLGVEGVSVMQTTFKSANVNLVTPSLTLSRDNIPLSGALCGAPGKESYCYSATMNLIVKHTGADVKTVDNTTVRFETALGWITTIPGLKITTIGGIQGSHYDHVDAGRRDWVADIAARADWRLSPNATLTGVIKYTYQRSSITAVDWDGFAVSPQLRLSWTF